MRIWPLHAYYSFIFPGTASTAIYTLSLHDALPISCRVWFAMGRPYGMLLHAGSTSLIGKRTDQMDASAAPPRRPSGRSSSDRKSTRLNSSHGYSSYAVFCLKKKMQLGLTT